MIGVNVKDYFFYGSRRKMPMNLIEVRVGKQQVPYGNSQSEGLARLDVNTFCDKMDGTAFDKNGQYKVHDYYVF